MAAWAVRMAGALLPRAVCRVPEAGRQVFLTFDDGPHPAATPMVLDQLAMHGAKASFFCLGMQAAAYPGLMARIRAEGHAAGHHTWDHPDGRRTANRRYGTNVARGAEAVGGVLFRPPYGRIGPVQARAVAREHRIVLWDVLAGDSRRGADGRAVAARVLDRTRAGSIIVFHDTPACSECLHVALPLVLHGLALRGLACAALPCPL